VVGISGENQWWESVVGILLLLVSKLWAINGGNFVVAGQ
jgi:hypothetical protein